MKTLDSHTIEQLITEIVALCGHIQAAEFRLLELIRRLDEARPWNRCEMPSCAHWLNWKCGIDLVTAREKVRVAHALPKLPLVSAAFQDGRLSYSKVRAITRIATQENEPELLQVALSNTAAHVEKIVKRYRQVERLQDARAAFNAYQRREFSSHFADDGSLVFEGRLPPEAGAMLLQALDRGVEWLFHGQPQRQRSSRDEARIQDVPLGERRADALAILAERFLAQPPGADEALQTADRFQLVVHASAESLPEYGAIDPNDPPQVQDGPVLAAETARRIGCDCSMVRIRETEHGEPLDIGRKTRTIPPAINRALKRRDRGCRFPGCTNMRFVDGHHIRHWADGGETKLGNLVLLCRHHHRLVHEGGYYIVKDGVEFIFARGDGEVVLRESNQRLTAGIDALLSPPLSA